MLNYKTEAPMPGTYSAVPQPVAEDVLWVYNGRIGAPPTGRDGEALTESKLIQRHGCVKISTGRAGTSITWALFASNWASLFFATEYLSICPGPYTLSYFLVGWFTEEFTSIAEARARLGVIQGKSDVHLQKRTFIKEVELNPTRLPHVLQSTIRDRMAMPELSVDVAYDDFSGTFQVGRVGSASLIAKYYGMNPVCYPCQSFHTYHHMVSKAYSKVLETNEPHYDHVLAAFQAPDASVQWFGYQRVVLVRFPNGTKGVSVVAAEGKVDIELI
ncbi:MAG: hypothetical protein NWR47_05785 [Aestuariivirgaceae bacterium]|nr:hypothetical protein [Aestuariivirgaceae bacterium]